MMASKGKFEGAAVVSFRGQPLTDTPIKSKLPIRNSRLPKKEIPPEIVLKTKAEEEALGAVTNENTKLNSHRHVKIECLKVIKETQRPASPSAHFRDRRPPVLERPQTLPSTPSPPTNRPRRVIFHKQVEHLDTQEATEPPFYDTTFPLRSCIKTKKGNIVSNNQFKDDFVIVQKFIYPED